MGVENVTRTARAALRGAFVEHAIAAAGAAGLRLPRDIRRAFVTRSPTRDKYDEMIKLSTNMGMSGGFVVPEWADPLLGAQRFVAYMGKRKHRERARLGRIDTDKPWGPGNAEWTHPVEQSKAQRARFGRGTASGTLAQVRARHRARLVKRAKEEHGRDLNSSDFLRRSGNYLDSTYRSILSRTSDTKDGDYGNYGGRGIYLYPPWSDHCHEVGFE